MLTAPPIQENEALRTVFTGWGVRIFAALFLFLALVIAVDCLSGLIGEKEAPISFLRVGRFSCDRGAIARWSGG